MAVDSFARAMIAEVITHGGGGGGGDGIQSVSVNGIPQPAPGGAVNIIVPTRVGALTNDKNYQSDIQVQETINASLIDYVPKSDYEALLQKVEAMELLLSKAGLSILAVQEVKDL